MVHTCRPTGSGSDIDDGAFVLNMSRPITLVGRQWFAQSDHTCPPDGTCIGGLAR